MNEEELRLWLIRAQEEVNKRNFSRAKKYLRWALDEFKEVEE